MSDGCKTNVIHEDVGASRNFGVVPICHCGDFSILKSTTTVKNVEKQFWGYPNYKVIVMELCFIKIDFFFIFYVLFLVL